jgi:hypothetical protein
MNCDCITRVNKKLEDQNLALSVSFVFSNNISKATDMLSIATHWKDSSKKPRGKKPTSILVSYCPFCGKKAKQV